MGRDLYTTLNMSIPAGLFCTKLQANLETRIRKRLRDVGYKLTYLAGQPWEELVEAFAIASLDRIHLGYGYNPWFWVVGWPDVLGAAAAEFFPGMAMEAERRQVASTAAAGELEALLMRHALEDPGAVGALPAPAARALRTIGQSALPAIPYVALDRIVPLSKPSSATALAHLRARSQHAMAGPGQGEVSSLSGSACSVPDSTPMPPTGAEEAKVPLAGAEGAGVPHAEQQQHRPPGGLGSCAEADEGDVDEQDLVESQCHCHCGRAMQCLQRSVQAYGEDFVAVCDRCSEPCGLDAMGKPPAPFLHCAGCRHDLCMRCAASATCRLAG